MSMFQMPKRRGTMNGLGRSALNRLNQSSDSLADPADSNGDAKDISSTDYAKRCRDLMELDRALRELGASMFFDLPRITVIGGQSAGKSSLVEAVSGINVPRDSGTCTRCPMECTMSNSTASWSCTISLRREYDTHGTQLEKPIPESFGPAITRKGDVELWLRRAQAAVLSPHRPTTDFLAKTDAELRVADPERLPFSKNVVCLDLKDPDAANLSFVDLPGLIQNGEPEMIATVRDLVVSRIAGNNTLILVTIPMSDDMENQQAVRLAKEADPTGERTIVVLTKPDTLGAGAIGPRQKWKEVLEGKSEYRLKHGYYCVRLPDDAERARGITRVESERLAAQYFDSTSPWKDIADRSRFGVPNLTQFLSQQLMRLIEANLPKLRDSVNQLLAEHTNNLRQLPSPVTADPSAEILLRVTSFCRDFRAATFGDDHKTLAQGNRRLYARFKREILRTTPDFRPSVGYSIEERLEEDPPLETSPSPPLDLVHVRKVIADSVAWELPKHVPFQATQTLVLQFTSRWKDPSISCFNAVFATSSVLIERLMVTHFGQFKQLENHVRTLTRAQLDLCKQQALETLEKLLALETLPLFTQNTEYLESESKQWYTKFISSRRRAPQYLTSRPVSPGNLYQPVYGDVPDEYQDELLLMANVRAYFEVAYKRIVDYLPLLIEHELNQSLASRLQGSLFRSFLEGADAAAKMKQLLSEDPAVSTKRQFLEGRIARLGEIKQKLDAYF